VWSDGWPRRRCPHHPGQRSSSRLDASA
jgi:hypothetical protein